MTITVDVPDTSSLRAVVTTLSSWQRDAPLVQLHPGDLGWAWRHGATSVAAALRVWSDDGVVVAIGFLDGPSVLRMTVAPERSADPGVARVISEGLSRADDERFPAGALSVEVPTTTAVHEHLASTGWAAGEAWTPLARDLSDPVDLPLPGFRAEVVDASSVTDFMAVHRSAWGNASFTAERWQTMVGGTPFDAGVCLLGRDGSGAPVAGVTVWGAGNGRPAILEPMGVHADHRGRGFGRAICTAAAAVLRERSASIAWVCTPSSLQSAVATYRSAGFSPLEERFDRVRPV